MGLPDGARVLTPMEPDAGGQKTENPPGAAQERERPREPSNLKTPGANLKGTGGLKFSAGPIAPRPQLRALNPAGAAKGPHLFFSTEAQSPGRGLTRPGLPKVGPKKGPKNDPNQRAIRIPAKRGQHGTDIKRPKKEQTPGLCFFRRGVRSWMSALAHRRRAHRRCHRPR